MRKRARTETIRRELREVQEKLAPLRKKQRELEKTISESSDVTALLAEVRSRRIERVKAELAARKIRRASELETKAEADKQWRADVATFGPRSFAWPEIRRRVG